MSYDSFEVSTDSSKPEELYLFSYNSIDYGYTSSETQKSLNIGGIGYVFNPEYIKRGDSLKLGDSSGTVETCTIYVLRNNPVALLYQGAPPEQDSVSLSVYRSNNTEYIKIIDGIISQVRFNDSEAEITINIESIMKRNMPKGTLSYYCQNRLYDSKCKVDEETYKTKCTITNMSGLTIYSNELQNKPSGYYTDGYIKIGNSYRQVSLHKDDHIVIKYPISKSDLDGTFYIYTGCNGLFSTCASKFSNTDNFSGIPYIQPYDPFKTRVGRSAYWVNSEVIRRDTKGEILGG